MGKLNMNEMMTINDTNTISVMIFVRRKTVFFQLHYFSRSSIDPAPSLAILR